MRSDIDKYRARRTRALKRREFLLPFDKLSYRLYFFFFERKNRAKELAVTTGKDRILVVCPHQDDELLGCGGFLLSCAGKAEVQIIFAIDCKGPARLRTEEERCQFSKIREKEGADVAAALGLNTPINLRLDDTSPHIKEDITRRISDEIRRFKPSTIMAPCFSDCHKQHLVVTQSLLGVDRELFRGISILLYRTHGLIPMQLMNRYFGLTGEIQTRKESILTIYRSQKLNVQITREKYLLYTKCMPASIRKHFTSIERFCCLDFPTFVKLDEEHRGDKFLSKIRGLNYAPFSFGRFIFNQFIFRISPMCRRTRMYD